MGWAPSVCAGPLTTSLWTVGQWPPATGRWWNARRGGDPKTDQVTQGADSELPGLATQRESGPTPTEKRNSRNSVGGISAQEGRGPKDTSARGKTTQGPWRCGATGCSRLSLQLLLRKGWTVARIGPLVIFVSLLDKRSVELTGCRVCFFRPASRGLPFA